MAQRPERKRQVITGRELLFALLLALLFVHLAEQSALAVAGTVENSATEMVENGGDSAVVVVPDEEADTAVESHRITEAYAGYRFLSLDGPAGNADQYEYLRSSLAGGLFHSKLGRNVKYTLDGDYRNSKDYYGDFLYDYRGDYRFHFRSESLFHNLQHLPLSPSFTEGPGSYSSVDADPSGRYGVQAGQDLAQFRYKLSDYPLHLNLGYWRFDREGSRQLRYSDHLFESTGNTIHSTFRPVHDVTEEGSFGVDGHFGYLDLVYTFTIRQFEAKSGIPRDTLFNNLPAATQFLQHNENPDSRYQVHTVKIHSALDGGMTGGGSYSYGRRENRSKLTDILGASETAATLQNIAGDFTYSPNAFWSLALKYRRQEVDNDTPATIFSTLSATSESVRQAFVTTKDLMTATLSYRPVTLWTIKGEYNGESIHRRFALPNINESLNWHGLPEESTTQKGGISLLGRPLKGLRLKADYSYAHTDNPSYGTSPESRHDAKGLVTYSAKVWGVTTSYRALRDSNDSVIRQQLTRNFVSGTTPDPTNPLSYSPYRAQARDRKTDNFSVNIWFVPVRPLTVSGSYGILHSKVEQGILFTIFPSISEDVATYRNQAQYYMLNGTYQVNPKATLSLILQQVRSNAEFRPQPLGSATSGVADISRVRTVENSLGARADYRFTEKFTGAVDYSFRDFDTRTNNADGGTVHIVTASMATRW